MDYNSLTAWSTFATAIGAFLLIVITILVERSKRRQKRADLHLQQIREYVFQPLQQQLAEHYLRILERWDVLLHAVNEEVTSKHDPVAGKVTVWKIRLAVRKSDPSPGGSLGAHAEFMNYDATFHYLYEDAKQRHFPVLFARWERFQKQVQEIGEESLQRCSSWEHQLNDRLQFGDINGQSSAQPWANYAILTLYLYTLLWLKHPNAAGLFNASNHWELKESGGSVLAQGSQEQLAMCREVLAEVARAEEKVMNELFERAERLKEEGEALKAEFGRLVLRHFTLGPCSYLESPQ